MRWFFKFIFISVFSLASHANELTQEQVDFVNNFQIALSEDDQDWIARNTYYPLRVGTENGDKYIHNKEELFEKFEDVFNFKIKNAVRQQNLNNIFHNWQGIMVGKRGQVWIITTIDEEEKERSWLIAVNH